MKNKKTESTSIFKKKGFYAALYSCVGLVLVMAAMITYNARNTTLQTPENYAENEVDSSELQSVSQSGDDSYLAKANNSLTDITVNLENESAFFKSDESEEAAKPADEKKSEPATDEKPTETSSNLTSEEIVKVTQATAPSVSVEVAQVETTEEAATQEIEVISVADTAADEDMYQTASVRESGLNGQDISSSEYGYVVLEGNANVDGLEEIVAEPVFSIFGDEQNMSWPVDGEIVMDFSPDKIIYDVTLKQYRTNDSISIKADLGTPVLASAEGIVRKISNTREDGISVVVDHGNGWVTTYSQLEEEPLIAEGDVVLKNQEIGTVSSPSIYNTGLGNHLKFSVTKNDVATDPKSVLN